MKNFKSFMSEGSKEEYQKFFDKKLAKYKVDSPEDLSDEEKKKFFKKTFGYYDKGLYIMMVNKFKKDYIFFLKIYIGYKLNLNSFKNIST